MAPNEILFDDTGVAFEVVEDEEVDEVSADEGEEDSVRDTAPSKPETRQTPSTTARQATPVGKVEVVEEPEEEEESEDEPASDEVMSDEDLEEAEAELDAWIEQIKADLKEEGAREAQSRKDREIAKVASKLKETEDRLKAVEAQNEETRLNGLTDEERTRYLDSKELERRKAALDEYSDTIVESLQAQLIAGYVQDYGQYGVTAADLEDIDDPDAMELFCEKAELKFYRNGGSKTPPAPQATAKPTRVAKPVPAGASAPADLGGNSPILSKQRNEPADGTGIEALAQTLSSLPFETVRLGG